MRAGDVRAIGEDGRSGLEGLRGDEERGGIVAGGRGLAGLLPPVFGRQLRRNSASSA